MIIKVVLLIAFLIGTALYEIPDLVNKHLFREIWVFSILMLLGFVLAMCLILGITITLPKIPT